jgi:hypothetical protein
VFATAAFTASDSELLSANPKLFVALKTKPEVVAVTVGVPEIVPDELNVSPVGKVPD